MDTANYIKEKAIKNAPESIDIDFLKTIIEKQKSICKIICKNGEKGTGFFCFIPFPDKLSPLPVLMTNNHVINKDSIIKGNIITFTLINDKFSFQIMIDEFRKTFTDIVYDITIIELRKNEVNKIDINSFFEVDEQVFNYDFKDIYRNKSIYLIGYPHGEKSKFSNGKIIQISEDNFTLIHNCSTEPGSSGCPIVNINNNKVIGIHKGACSKADFNLGTLLKEPIEKFKDINLNNKNESNLDQEKLITSFEKIDIKGKDPL